MEVPNHVGIIIDGNRRWATARNMASWKGHWSGVKNLERILKNCMELGISEVSIYTLSTENLKRSKRELDELFKIFYHYLNRWEKQKDGFLDKYQVKVRFIGDLGKLPPKVVRVMDKIIKKTAEYQKRTLNLLIAYGSRFEIIEAIKKLVKKIKKTGRISIIEKDVEENLSVTTPVDLVIRTGGMSRLSNFLLWQASYAELIFLKKLWPDFTKRDLILCIKEFNRRQRNFGK